YILTLTLSGRGSSSASLGSIFPKIDVSRNPKKRLTLSCIACTSTDTLMNNFKTLREFVENAIQLRILQTEMFGVDIESFMKLQRAHVKFLKVPWVVRLCADEMIRRGM